MDESTKQRILLFLALFLTFFFLMGVFERHAAPRPPAKAPDAPTAAAPAATPEAPPAATPLPATPAGMPDAAPTGPAVDGIRIEGKEYEAVFTTRGGALRTFSLRNQYLVPRPEKPEAEGVVLLDELAAGRLSLALDRMESTAPGEAKGKVLSGLRDAPWRLVGAPRGATLPEALAAADRNDRDELVFSATIDGWEIRKTYAFAANRPHGFSLAFEFRNAGAAARKLFYSLAGPSGMVPDDANRGGFLESMSYIQGLSAMLKGEGPATDPIVVTCNELDKAGKEAIEEALKKGRPEAEAKAAGEAAMLQLDGRARIAWVGTKNRFFTALLSGDEVAPALGGEVRAFRAAADYRPPREGMLPALRVHAVTGEAFLLAASDFIPAGGSFRHAYKFYGGPADDAPLAYDPRLESAVSYTWRSFDWLSRLMMAGLNGLAAVARNYGVAIILLTLIVKTLMHPLTRKAMVSGQRMQRISPLVKELQRKHANDRQRLHTEVMRLYREQGVSPLGGCLPMLLQFPIFIALYGAFSRGFSGRHAFFIPGWMEDLSQPDRLWSWATPLPLVGWTDLNVLPIIYLVVQIVQMSMQPQSEDPQVQQQQKMMKWMPAVFMFIFYTMPAGLVLYFTISSLYTLVEQWHIKKHIDRTLGPAPSAAAAPAGAAPAAGAGIGFGKKT